MKFATSRASWLNKSANDKKLKRGSTAVNAGVVKVGMHMTGGQEQIRLLAHLSFPNCVEPITKPLKGHKFDGVGVVVVYHQCCVQGRQRWLKYIRNERNGNLLNVKPRQANCTGKNRNNQCDEKGKEAANNAQNAVRILYSGERESVDTRAALTS
jgi:hypothetical protein